MSFKSNGVVEFRVDKLLHPDSGVELPRFYKLDGKNTELISFPKFKKSPYIMLERVNYDRKKGHVEGIILRFEGEFNGEDEKGITLGSGNKVECLVPGLANQHFTIHFKDSVFLLSDHKTSTGTYLKRYNQIQLNAKCHKERLLINDFFITLSLSTNAPATKKEFIDTDGMTLYRDRGDIVIEDTSLQNSEVEINKLTADPPVKPHMPSTKEIFITSENISEADNNGAPAQQVPRLVHKFKKQNN